MKRSTFPIGFCLLVFLTLFFALTSLSAQKASAQEEYPQPFITRVKVHMWIGWPVVNQSFTPNINGVGDLQAEYRVDEFTDTRSSFRICQQPEGYCPVDYDVNPDPGGDSPRTGFFNVTAGVTYDILLHLEGNDLPDVRFIIIDGYPIPYYYREGKDADVWYWQGVIRECPLPRADIYPFDDCESRRVDLHSHWPLDTVERFTPNINGVGDVQASYESDEFSDDGSFFKVYSRSDPDNLIVHYQKDRGSSQRTGPFDVTAGTEYEARLALAGGDISDQPMARLWYWQGVYLEGDGDDDVRDDYCFDAQSFYSIPDPPSSGALEYGGDDDWHLIHVDDYGEVRITLQAPSGKNYDLELYRDCSYRLAAAVTNLATEVIVAGVAPGDYRVHVYGRDPSSDFGDSNYVIDAEFGNTLGDPNDDSYQRIDPYFSYVIPHSTPGGSLEIPGDNDWHILSSPADGGLLLTLDVPPGKNYELELWGSGPCDGDQRLVLSQNPSGMDEYLAFPVRDGCVYRSHIFGADPATDFGLPYNEQSSFFSIAISPKNATNIIDLQNDASVSVAILSTHNFDATAQVDRESLRFGRTGDEDSLLRVGPYLKPACSVGDTNNDGYLDLGCRFEVSRTGLQCGDPVGILKAQLPDFAGALVEGRDWVEIVPCD